MLIKNAQLSKGENVDILIENGIIVAVGSNIQSADENVVNASGLTALPAFIDLHCHFRTPGFEHKETIETGSQAAARGGYTMVTCMANTNPVCSNEQIAKGVMDKAKEYGICDVQQCISITENFDGESVNHLKTLSPQYRFISDDGKGVQSNYTMWHAMQIAKEKNLVVMSHAEDMLISPEDYRLAENIETYRNVMLAKITGAQLHMCHVSTKEAMENILYAKDDGVNVTCEVTPHHIWFHDIDYRVNPPIRAKADVDYIINAMKQGKIDAIATDHAPHTPEDKEKGAPGMVGLETAFSICYTKLCKENGLPLETLSHMMSTKPAEILGVNKGKIEKGYDGDIVLVNLQEQYTINKDNFAGKSHNTPYDGVTVVGNVVKTIKNGKITYEK